ncbi:MAG: hypothetical protein HQL33_11670 [Alphaproteobacteria bacterium]|nr:hypothetical protein [Alphaproteobacteria bacterium]
MILFFFLSLFVAGAATALWVLTRLSALTVSLRGIGRRRASGREPARIKGEPKGEAKGEKTRIQDEKRLLGAEIRRLENAKTGLMDVLSALELKKQGIEHRSAEAERAAEDADRRARMAEKREEEASWRAQDTERAIVKKLEELSEAERDLAAAKKEATEGIAAWTKTQQSKLEERLNDQYQTEIDRLKNEMMKKIHDEIERIQSYFIEFATTKKTFATNDISNFVSDRLNRLKMNL